MTATTQTECTRCSELLLEYIAANNQLIDTRADQLAAAILDHALEQRSVLRKRLSLHQELHRLPAIGRRA